MEEVYKFLREANTYYLATIEGDQPRVRPFGTVDIFQNRLYIQTGKSKAVSEQMQINSNIEICAFMNNEWLRIEAKAVRDENQEAKQHMLDSYPSLQKMYSATDDNTEVLYLDHAKATFYSFTGQPRTISF